MSLGIAGLVGNQWLLQLHLQWACLALTSIPSREVELRFREGWERSNRPWRQPTPLP